jgi:hypothetical protein
VRGIFPQLGYLGWGKLTAGLSGVQVPVPSEKAVHDLRRRELAPASGFAATMRSLMIMVSPVHRPQTQAAS